MKKINLSEKQISLNELFALAKTETVLIHSVSGDDFILESAEDFEREVVSLGGNEKFMSFLEMRSKESGDIPLSEICQKNGVKT